MATLSVIALAGCAEASETAPDGSVYEYETYGSSHPNYYCVITGAESGSEVLHVPAVLEGYDVRSISSGAFDGCAAKAVVVPPGVRSIEAGAFRGCERLTDVYFLGDRPDMGGAFREGVAIHSLEGAAGWEGSETIANVEAYGVEYAILPDGAMAVGGVPTGGVLRISSEVGGEKVSSIGPYAFAGAMRADGQVERRSDIVEAVLPEGLAAIGQRAFYYSDIERVSVPESLGAVDDETFRACYRLESFDLAGSTRYIGFEAFRDCRSLEQVSVPEGVAIGEGAFYLCSSLNRAEVCSTPARIFGYCGALESVDIGGSPSSIGDMAFYRCSSLKEASLPGSVRTIGSEAFYGCESLCRVSLGSVEEIGRSAFRGCSSMASVAMPASLGRVGGYAFADCVSLGEVHARGGCPEGDDTVFLNDSAKVLCSAEHRGSWERSPFGLEVEEEGGGTSGFLMLVVIVAAAAVVALLGHAILRRRRARI